MLEGMVPAQARAVQAEAGRLLLYCPIVRNDELDASLAYLARRFDENTTPENFLRAMFELTPDSPAWDEQAERFRRSVAQRSTVDTSPRRPGVVRHIEFLRLSEHRVLLILVTGDGDVQNRMIVTSRDHTQSELVEATNYVNAHYVGLDIEGGLIRAIHSILNPEKLGHLGPVSDVGLRPSAR